MSTITISQPKEQAPLYTDRNCSVSENKIISNPLNEISYRLNSSNPANSFFKQNVTWEYYSNELEFE